MGNVQVLKICNEPECLAYAVLHPKSDSMVFFLVLKSTYMYELVNRVWVRYILLPLLENV